MSVGDIETQDKAMSDLKKDLGNEQLQLNIIHIKILVMIYMKGK